MEKKNWSLCFFHLCLLVFFLSLLNCEASKDKFFLHKIKSSSAIWLKPHLIKSSYIFLSLKTSEEDKNETLTEDKVKEIMKQQNEILKEEMKKTKTEIKEEINKTNHEFDKKLNQSTITIKNLIKNNHIKIKNALRKLEFQIKETSKENDDVASIILQKEIDSKEKKKDELAEEVESLEKDIPNEFLDGNGASNCTGQMSCRDCTQNSNCGWCNMYQLCVDGDQFGPIFSVCSFYSYDTCNDNDCNNYNRCDVIMIKKMILFKFLT